MLIDNQQAILRGAVNKNNEACVSNEPRYRYHLKGKIHESGFRTIGEFSRTSGIDISRISRIVNGWEYPSTILQEKMKRVLKMNSEEFLSLL